MYIVAKFEVIDDPYWIDERFEAYMHSDFAFLNPKIQVNASMLSSGMLASKTYHLICTPARCIDLVTDILAKRAQVLQDYPNLLAGSVSPVFVWEPMEGSCRPQERPSFHKALSFVDIFSPNEHELTLLFNGPSSEERSLMPTEELRGYCKELLGQESKSRLSAIVVRMGPSGCIVVTRNQIASFPAYHTLPKKPEPEEIEARSDNETQTWDVTGGGNAFLGGFCIGLLSTLKYQHDSRDLSKFEIAAIYGSVAASFAIEQVSMPKLSLREGDGQELWNGEGEQCSRYYFPGAPNYNFLFLTGTTRMSFI